MIITMILVVSEMKDDAAYFRCNNNKSRTHISHYDVINKIPPMLFQDIAIKGHSNNYVTLWGEGVATVSPNDTRGRFFPKNVT